MFNWKNRLTLLKKGVSFRVFNNYKEKASKYAFCATGELKDALEAVGYEFDGNKPLDQSILTLSLAFYNAIQDRKFDEAETIYNSLIILSKGEPD